MVCLGIDLELPKVPVIYDTSRRLNSIARPYEEGSDLTLVCEVAGGNSNPIISLLLLLWMIQTFGD